MDERLTEQDLTALENEWNEAEANRGPFGLTLGPSRAIAVSAVPRLIADLRAAKEAIEEARLLLEAADPAPWVDDPDQYDDRREEWLKACTEGQQSYSNTPSSAPKPPRTPETEATGQEDGTRGQDGGTVVETRSDLCGCYHERQDHMLDGTCRGAQCRCQRFRLLRGGA